MSRVRPTLNDEAPTSPSSSSASTILDCKTQPLKRAEILVRNGLATHLNPTERAMEIADRVFKSRDTDLITDKPNRSNPRYQNFCDKVEALIENVG